MQEKENNSFSRKVRMLRLDYGLTQPDLAKLMDVSVRTVASWESGKKRKHEVMLWDQIQKAVGNKKKNTDAQPIINSESEENDEMWKDKYIEEMELNKKLLLEISSLKDALMGKQQPSKVTNKKVN